ncbi:MAG: Hpt domain-containing protein [Acidobacteriota bacterium]|nr:Hpt domain-containing protein [Acidobacteriota bacterium]
MLESLARDVAVLDASVMAAIRTLGEPGEPDVFAEVARIFLDDVPRHLDAMDDAIAAGRADSVEQLAHRLRGGALEMGALRMAPLCAAIEEAAHAGSLQQAETRAAALRGEFDAASIALRDAIQ